MLKAILHTRPVRQLRTIFTRKDLVGKRGTDDVEAIAAGLPPLRMQGAHPELVARR